MWADLFMDSFYFKKNRIYNSTTQEILKEINQITPCISDDEVIIKRILE